jgi:hypothetical protein
MATNRMMALWCTRQLKNFQELGHLTFFSFMDKDQFTTKMKVVDGDEEYFVTLEDEDSQKLHWHSDDPNIYRLFLTRTRGNCDPTTPVELLKLVEFS